MAAPPSTPQKLVDPSPADLARASGGHDHRADNSKMRLAGHADFFSIGTNDLTADVLGRDRVALHPASASERTVLTAIATVTRAARQAGIGVSVCGDAAADPEVLPLLLGLGVRTVSVGAAKVPRVAQWVAGTDAGAAAKAAERHAG